MTPAADHRRGLDGQPPRSGRRRVSDREKVVLHPEGQPKAQVSGGQRRRRGAGDLQGSVHPRAGSPRASRRHDHRRLRDREPQGLRLHSRRVLPVGRALQRAVEEAYAQGWLGKNIQGSGFDLDVVDPSRRRRVHLRRRDGLAHLSRRREGVSQAQAAVPRNLRPLPVPDDRQQRRDAGVRAVHPARGRRDVSPASGRPSRAARGSSRSAGT